jgi:hypothetical protein
LYGKERHKEILFTDEKRFIVEETFNKQNDRVYAGHSRKPANWCQGSDEVIILVWWGVFYDGGTSLISCEKGVKTAPKPNYAPK